MQLGPCLKCRMNVLRQHSDKYAQLKHWLQSELQLGKGVCQASETVAYAVNTKSSTHHSGLVLNCAS